MVSAVIIGAINGKTTEVVASVTTGAKSAFEIALGLAGMMTFWLGIMSIAEKAGLIQQLGRLLQPIMKWLFPDIPPDHPAMGSMLLNISANMLGLNNAATPFGLRAMHELQQLNKLPHSASNAMCTFLAINTSSVQIIPATAITYLVAAGANRPTQVIATSLIATACSTLAAIIAVKSLEKLRFFTAKRSTALEDTP